MDYYQGVVGDYLRAHRSVFIKDECYIQLSDKVNVRGQEWYCDLAAVDFHLKVVFLCEITFAKKANALVKRLKAWSENWDGILLALQRDAKIPENWSVRPWLFVPRQEVEPLVVRLKQIPRLKPRITTLESVQPWRYRSWDFRDEDVNKSDPAKDTYVSEETMRV